MASPSNSLSVLRFAPLSCYALFVLLATPPGLVACTSDHGEPDRLTRHTAAQKTSGQPIGKQFAEIAEFAVSNMIVEGLQYSLIQDGEVVARSMHSGLQIVNRKGR